jgi:hypothetical protein
MARPKRPRQDKAKRRYELWNKIQSLHCQINLEPIDPRIGPRVMDNVKAAKWAFALEQREKAEHEWLGKPGERINQLKREATC